MIEIPRNKHNESRFTAFIDTYLTFPNYMGSYKRSFDILLEEVVKSNCHIDYIAYPLLFMARHCMELGLKTNIIYFSNYSKTDHYSNIVTHDLEKLFEAFKMQVNFSFVTMKNNYGIEVDEVDKRSFNELCCEVQKLNQIFHILDKNSDAFRYPIDKMKNPSFKIGERINILEVNNLLEKAMTLFSHTADVFSKYTDYVDEIENYYKGLISQQYEY